jgi:hypothetical protein
MSDTPSPAGYQITRELGDRIEIQPHCVSCVERDGLLVWEHVPIYEDPPITQVPEAHNIKCDTCGRLLIVDYLQRQIEARDKALKELSSFLAYDLGGCNGPDWQRIRELQKQIEPFVGWLGATKIGKIHER